VRLARTSSTMDVLHELAREGAAAGIAVVAEEQGAGRGSRGRSWDSPRGGLWLSVLTRPPVAALELLSLRAGLAMAELLASRGAGDRVRVKWPNDLMLDERKVGGILCEARWQGDVPAWVVVGLGLNVANQAPPGLEEEVARLADVLPWETPESLVEAAVAVLRDLDAAAGPLDSAELARLNRLDWLRGRTLNTPASGVADGIDADGTLRVRRADGTITAVRAGSVGVAGTSAGT
jgi:BirA family biotin operon repressor/biotin-[acetyl-CoA-carboxylase] ligase